MPRRRVDLREAAEILGTSVDAVRKRVQRGTLESEKVDGKVYVWLDDGAPRSDTDALISEMRAHNETLRAQLEAERQAHAEARRLLAAALERIPAIEVPSEPPGSSEKVEEPERAEPHAATGGAQTVSEHRSVDDPPRLRWHVVGVILSILASTFSYVLITRLVPGFSPTSFLAYLLFLSLVIPALVVIPAFFGFRLGRKVRSRRFWRHLVAIGALIVLGNFLLLNVALALELLMNGVLFSKQPFHDFFRLLFCCYVSTYIFFSGIPGLIYISAAVLGNAIQRRNSERLMEQRPAGLPPESAAAAQRWTPQQQAIVGLAGTILSALIGLIGTILTIMTSGNGG